MPWRGIIRCARDARVETRRNARDLTHSVTFVVLFFVFASSKVFFSFPLCFAGETGQREWCTLAYWELAGRVGRLYPVEPSTVNVFDSLHDGDGLCLATLAENHNASPAVQRTRSKIGLGKFLKFPSIYINDRNLFSFFRFFVFASSFPRTLPLWCALLHLTTLFVAHFAPHYATLE